MSGIGWKADIVGAQPICNCRRVNRAIEILAGLVSAAAVATALMTAISSVAASVADLFGQIETLQSPFSWLLETVFSAISNAVFGVVFGFIGAVIILAIALLPWGASRSQTASALAGGLAGLVHSILGWALRIADKQIGPLHPLEGILQSISLWGGFLLTTTPRVDVALATIPASVIAGCAAGIVFFRVINGSNKLPT